MAFGLFTSVTAQIINFPDANFKAKLLESSYLSVVAQDGSGSSVKIDTNNDGEIQVSEASQIYYLNVRGPVPGTPGNITSLIGIQNFTNLRGLDCRGQQLVSLDLSGNTSLRTLSCCCNQIANLNLTGLVNLIQLECSGNQLTTLDLSDLRSLYYFDCHANQLQTLDLSSSSVGTNSWLKLDCSFNNLSNVNIKSGRLISSYSNFKFQGNPLQYVCIDVPYVSSFKAELYNYQNYTNVEVNSYCSFTPGGTFYTIKGNQKVDINSNGCDSFDNPIPYLRFNISNGTTNGSLISDYSGNYSIAVQEGSHTIAPFFEYPNYFNVTPSFLNVNFPSQASPFTQNFCITPNSNHPDLELNISPIIPVRPGMNAKYYILYKNNGNVTQSGSINLVFNDAVLDFVTSIPAISAQTTNNLSWNFTNLLPFETRAIEITLNVNSPIEIPSVNAGYILNYVVSVNTLAIDETPNDNTFTFNQTVVNSFDPNDKTCLEGATIAPSEVGKYVHYMIRFENTGTANAQNIVVKDMIDTAKFDLNSLVPMKGSHSFVTNITAGNKVEFIFENINLPFDDANNDGYIAFKIKTKPTLINGDTFSNTASIYFDYNFPIVTNTATTTIATLARQDFEFSSYFNLYPNPVNNILNISAKETIEITSINIYNTLGQLVLVIPNATNIKTIDVSNLTSGNYFIKINSDKGTANTKFIKN